MIAMLLILISLSCVNATQINETEPMTASATDDILNTNLNNFSALNDEINALSQTKTLELTKDYAFDSNNDAELSNGITIAIDNFTIDGKGHTINANSQARVFNIQAKNVVLKNLIITNGNSDSAGGAIYWSGSNGKIIDSTFRDCMSHFSGGAVYFRNSANVVNSKFINNTANFAGAVDFESESIVENCEFEKNTAGLLGGAVYSVEKTSFYNSKFSQNKAGDGGAIYFFTKGLVENTEFENNLAIGYGGAIVNDDFVTIMNSIFTKNVGYVDGGAIYLKGNGYINCSNFTENHANKTGGAISIYSNAVEISNCEFNHNEAEKGKSIEVSNNKNFKLENATFNNDPSTYESELKIQSENSTLINVSYNNVTKKVETTPVKTTTPAKTTTVVKKTVKKVTKKKTAITAKSKKFKAKKKTKKYVIKLKTGKTPLKGKKIKLKLRGKTYTAKTNKKGQATFKLKITKKGKFKAVIRFYGDKLYKACKKTVYIKIKR